jgi:hypothetical protein
MEYIAGNAMPAYGKEIFYRKEGDDVMTVSLWEMT